MSKRVLLGLLALMAGCGPSAGDGPTSGSAEDLGPAVVAEDQVGIGEFTAGTKDFNPEKMRTMCAQVAVVEGTDGFRTFSDQQVRNGTCMMAALGVEAISRKDAELTDVCVAATATMMRQFKARFPDEEPSAVAGKC